MKYVVVDIGCIECGEQSGVLGIFTNKKKAKIVAKKYEKIQSDNWSGQHCFEIFEVKEEDVEVYDKKNVFKTFRRKW